jgi:hypothetical protein
MSLQMWKVEHKVSIPIVAPKITTLINSNYCSVIVPSVNKFGPITKSIYFSSSMTPSIRS